MLWDVNDGKHLYSLDAGGTINALTFSPKNYWLCAATDTSIKVQLCYSEISRDFRHHCILARLHMAMQLTR